MHLAKNANLLPSSQGWSCDIVLAYAIQAEVAEWQFQESFLKGQTPQKSLFCLCPFPIFLCETRMQLDAGTAAMRMKATGLRW